MKRFGVIDYDFILETGENAFFDPKIQKSFFPSFTHLLAVEQSVANSKTIVEPERWLIVRGDKPAACYPIKPKTDQWPCV